MKKILLTLFGVIVLCIGYNAVNAAVNPDITDVLWDWKVLNDNMSSYSEQALINQIISKIDGNKEIEEYMEMCNLTKEKFAKLQLEKIRTYLKDITRTDANNRKYLRLDDVIKNLNNDIPSMLLLDILKNKYPDIIYLSGDKQRFGSGELITKAYFEKLISGKSDTEKGELRNTFAQIYYIQKTMCQNLEYFIDALEHDEAQKDNVNITDKFDTVFITKDSEIMNFLYKNGYYVGKADSYDKLSDSCFVNTSDEYAGAYVYFFIDPNEFKEWAEFSDSQQGATDRWDEETTYIPPISMDILENKNFTVKFEHYYYDLDWSIIENLMSTGDSIKVYDGTSNRNRMSEYDKETLLDHLINNKIDFASFLYHGGDKYNYTLNEALEEINHAINESNLSMGNEYITYEFNCYTKKYFYSKQKSNKTYTITLANNHNDSTEVLRLCVPAEDRQDTSYYYLPLRGYWDDTSKTFTIDFESKNIFYIRKDKKNVYLVELGENRQPKEDFLDVKTLKIQTTTKSEKTLSVMVESKNNWSFQVAMREAAEKAIDSSQNNQTGQVDEDPYKFDESLPIIINYLEAKKLEYPPKDLEFVVCSIDLDNYLSVLSSNGIITKEDNIEFDMQRYDMINMILGNFVPSNKIAKSISNGMRETKNLYKFSFQGVEQIFDYNKEDVSSNIYTIDAKASIKKENDYIGWNLATKSFLSDLLEEGAEYNEKFEGRLLAIKGSYNSTTGVLTIDPLGKEVFILAEKNDRVGIFYGRIDNAKTINLFQLYEYFLDETGYDDPQTQAKEYSNTYMNHTDYIRNYCIFPIKIQFKLNDINSKNSNIYLRVPKNKWEKFKSALEEVLNSSEAEIIPPSVDSGNTGNSGSISSDGKVTVSNKYLKPTLALLKTADFSKVTYNEANKVDNTIESKINYEKELAVCPDGVNVNSICNDDWWQCAFAFFKRGEQEGVMFQIGQLTDIKEMIFYVGNIIFILITAILGVKYIWGSVESKASIKNSLFTLIVAALVFYGWNSISELMGIQELFTGSTAAGSYKGIATQVYSIVLYIINFLAIGGIIYIGIKYMLAGADGKAEMKVKLLPAVVGIIMVYGTIQAINFVLAIAGVI